MFATTKLSLVLMTISMVYSDTVVYPLCDAFTLCPEGMMCTQYSPCYKGYCNKCITSNFFYPHSSTSNTFECKKATYPIGDTGCNYDWECVDEKSYCYQSILFANVCKCPTGFQASSDSLSCVSQGTVKLGASCSNNYQCGNNASCNANKFCQCNANYRSKSNSLFDCEQYKPGDSCAPAYCLGASNCPGATCASGTYQCQVDYTWVNQIQIAQFDAVVTSGACVLSSARKDVGLAKSCTLLWPYTEICASGLMCHQCGENPYNVGECVNNPTSGNSPASTSTTPTTTTTTTTNINPTRTTSINPANSNSDAIPSSTSGVTPKTMSSNSSVSLHLSPFNLPVITLLLLVSVMVRN